MKSLQGFKRIHLKPGESQLVRFTLVPEQMASLDDNQVWVVEPGEVLIETGGTVQSVRLVGDNVFIPN